MKYLLIFASLMILAGCEPIEPRSSTNQCLRTELFNQCMVKLPAGPLATKYNDWDEVVSECGSQAYYQAQRLTSTIPMECRSY